MSQNFFSLIRSRTTDDDKVFIRTVDGRSYTYGEMWQLSARFANVLSSKGVVIGDRVAVQVDKSPEAIILYLACLRAGVVYLPLNTAYTLAELEYFIGDAKPHVVVCTPDKYDAIEPMASSLGVFSTLTLGVEGNGTLAEEAASAAPSYETILVEQSDLAAILYTSGTTGRSKGAMLTHANLASNARTLVEYWHFTDRDELLHALPIFHTHGLFVATNVILLSSASMCFLPKFDPKLIRQEMRTATVMMGVPTFYTRLLREDWLNRDSTDHMRLFISGSAPLLADTHRAWTEKTGHHILERYGMTETNMITSNPYDGERVPGSVGPALPGVSVRITEPESGKLLPANSAGMIEVRGPNVFKGYWRMPDKTQSEFRADGYFITGDIGYMDDDGYVFVSGRSKDLVITGGYNVYPKEIESEIDSIEGVEESAVVGLPHADFGEAVTAVVILKDGVALTEADIMSRLDPVLAKYKLPKRILFEASLPRNTMGKVLKNEIRKQHEDLYK
ncbi:MULTISPECIES: malonyl-CoA synthase [unclassified Mesorhizobium]|uniref:malonate--CoA ligase n=1 Tax=unclassified Mesorhizobium TaxID=325217 RepID=UPI000868CD50|nr:MULTISPECIES: malonyl-CoA synthase [unclassified Mesorhizobium]MBN9254958.1 malonyl-CoA synthase [Mesorhizobium sp.]MBN9270256.1 malonyl-CoA synthase [Mesorhizobium sp.]ODT12693.1 MAG: malonyl-CoA synthase [Mesorhizobium sp. SCN 65-12]OJX76121.1 MAG: malonyl-CoA synthase [Mesorhizobium sp. 65-26]